MRRGLLIALFCSAAFGQNAFDTADVHVSAPVTNPTMRGGALRGGRFEVRTATMVDLISFAYDMESNRVLGGPSWLDWDRFDVAAKAAPGATHEKLILMVQKLLADRFQLVVHKDTKPMPAYALTAGKGKPKMKEASGSGEPACQNVPQKAEPGTVPYVVLSCHHITMAVFADVLEGYGR